MACRLSEKEIANLLEIHRKDPLALPDAMREMMHPDRTSQVLEWWKAGLLSGPPTHGVNFVSNAVKQAMTLAETGIAGVIDPVLAKLYKRDRERYVGEVGASLSGAKSAMPQAMADLFGELWEIARLKPEKIDPDVIGSLRAREDSGGKFDFQVGAIGGKFGRAVRTPFRLLEATDRFFKRLAEEQEIHKLAYRAAKREKKTGNAFDLRTRELIGLYRSSKGEHPAVAGWAEKVKHARQYESFQLPLNEKNQGVLGTAGAAFQVAAQKHPWLQAIVPFTRTPANIAYQTLERTPLGLMKALKSGNADDMAKVVLGATIGAIFAGMAAAGELTGGGPEDPDEKRNLEKTGWQEYSIKVNGTWYSYKRLQPASSLIAMAADIHEAKDEKTARGRFQKYLGSFVDAIVNETYLQGLQNAGQFLHDPVRYSGTFFKQLESSVVPAGVRRVAQAVDPTIRKTNAFDGSAILAGIPGASKRLPPVVAGTGEEAQRTKVVGEETLGGVARVLPTGFVNASTPKGREADFERTLHQLGYVPSPAGNHVTVRGVQYPLTPAEREALSAADRRTTASLRATIRSPEFSMMAPADKEALIKRRYDRGREAVRNQARARAAAEARRRPQPPQART